MGCCCKKGYPWRYKYYPVPYPLVLNYPATFPTVFMRGKEIDCWFAGVLEERHIDGLVFQYDKGLVLNVRGIDVEAINEIQFGRTDTIGVKAYEPETIDPLASDEETPDDTEPDTGDDTQDPVDPDPSDPASGNDDPETGDQEDTEPTSDTAEEMKPEDYPYLSVAIPDELLLTPGTIVAYCVYHTEDEFRTVKTIYITVHERQAVKEEESEETNSCGCTEQITALQETIAALTERIAALENPTGNEGNENP